MITPDGWFDFALRDPGPADKVYTQPNAGIGVVPHSMEGSYQAARSRLFNVSRDPDGTYTNYAAASWIGSGLKNGQLIQHYPITASTWTSGARYPNTHFDAFEFEGKAGETFTNPQIDTLERIVREIGTLRGWSPRRPLGPSDRAATLYEHNEMVRWGADPTACPSARVPWQTLLARFEEDDMAITLVACGDAPGGFRLYALGQGSPMWILDPKAATDLKATFGEPKGISWAALKSLGA